MGQEKGRAFSMDKNWEIEAVNTFDFRSTVNQIALKIQKLMKNTSHVL